MDKRFKARKGMVRIEVPAFEGYTIKDLPRLQDWFKHYNCYLVESSFKQAYWIIYGDTGQDIFWLGCNMSNSLLNNLLKEIEELKAKLCNLEKSH